MTRGDGDADWWNSGQVRRALRISTCELAHLRAAGALRFRKQGNAYLYAREDVQRRAAPTRVRARESE